jgi:hypothetical protein
VSIFSGPEMGISDVVLNGGNSGLANGNVSALTPVPPDGRNQISLHGRYNLDVGVLRTPARMSSARSNNFGTYTNTAANIPKMQFALKVLF